MLLNLAEDLWLEASAEDVWKLLRDTPRFAGLLPGVETVKAVEGAGGEAYAATVRDKIGPFKLSLNLELRVVEVAEPTLVKALFKGGDGNNSNRVSGTLKAALGDGAADRSGTGRSGTELRFEASVEVLGTLATLGTVAIKRRTTQLFAEFARNIQAQFARENS